ncbi:cdc73 domain protein [Anaeramoeba flamelloides]|uniref:Cdc73 domain protein n=1 Tax=Anaeramoeba flamelloides TaxID=1746091 RepID=A0ABQ8XKN2_9EUKA|nr:cdc73 domain protein [Anaeramoeba flamelloides]
MNDPLELLRYYLQHRLEITEQGHYLVFGNKTFPKDLPTKLQQSGQSKQYTLGCLWFFMKHKDISVGDYLGLCRNKDISRVGYVDRGSVAKFFQNPSTIEFLPNTRNQQLDSRKRIYDPNNQTNNLNSNYQSSYSLGTNNLQNKNQQMRNSKNLIQNNSNRNYQSGYINNSVTNKNEDHLLKKRRTNKIDENGKINYPKTNLDSIPLEVSVTDRIIMKEKHFQTRQSFLISQTKDFSNVIDIYQSISKKEVEQSKQQYQENDRRHSRNHSDNNQFWVERFGADDIEQFQINTKGSFYSETAKDSHQTEKRQPRSSSRYDQNPKYFNKKKKPNKIPIIIVPSAVTSVLTLWNVKEFLEDGVFIPYQEIKKKKSKKERNLIVIRKIGNKQIKYEIVDNPKFIAREDWKRVVSIFAHGQKWQFRGWPISDPVEIFNNYCSFHFIHGQEQIHPNLKNMNVKVVVISKFKRYLDKQIVLEIWKELDDFIAAKKPQLLDYIRKN